MITQLPTVYAAGQYAPCLAGALSALLPAQTGAARSGTHSAARGAAAAAAAASSCVSTRGISSAGKDFDADDKLGRPTTPWVRQVISGVDLMRHPKYNKGEWGANGVRVLCCCSASAALCWAGQRAGRGQQQQGPAIRGQTSALHSVCLAA